MASLAGGVLSSIFNMQNLVTAALDVALFAWMHFTPDGMIFGASVAQFLGFVEPLSAIEGVKEVVSETGEMAYAL